MLNFILKKTFIAQITSLIISPINAFILFSLLMFSLCLESIVLKIVIVISAIAIFFIPIIFIMFFLTKKIDKDFIENNQSKIIIMYIINIILYIIFNCFILYKILLIS